MKTELANYLNGEAEKTKSEPAQRIERALLKYPKAKRIAVENFTSGGYGKWDMAAAMNLEADRAAYNWNTQTVSAIRHVMQGK